MRYFAHKLKLIITITVNKSSINSNLRNLTKLKNPSAERNKAPILEILKKVLTTSDAYATLLEISSGVGSHVAHFAPHFPNIKFQPSEYDKTSLESIEAYIEDCPTKNICQPMFIDVSTPYTSWGTNKFQEGPYLSDNEHKNFLQYANSFSYMLNINMIHITPYACTEGLFNSAGALLKPKGLLITYGPYAENGVLKPESNVQFDASLRARDPTWGVKDLVDLKTTAAKYGIIFRESHEMPANNKCVIWEKE